jgi:hypothetical protein
VHPYVGGYFVGSECYIPAKDYFSKLEDVSWEYAFQRQWLFYKSWGRLLYNPSAPDDLFVNALDRKFGNGEKMFKAYNAAGQVPLKIASFWDLAWDFTLYAEGLYAFNGETGRAEFISVDRLMKHPTLDTAVINIDKFTDMVIKEAVITGDKITPLQFADDLEKYSKEALQYIATLEADDNTLRYELADITIWSNLGLYFSEKVRAATALSMYEKTQNEDQKLKAIQHLEDALLFWETIVEISNPLYKEMPLVHLNQQEDKYFHWAKLIDEVKKDIEIAEKK